MRREIAVLGAGVLGLTTALRLAQRGHQITIYEREAEPGGLASGFLIGKATSGPLAGQDVWLDKFYHHLFTSDRHAISLIEGSGLAEALEWWRPLTVTLRGGQVYQLDDPASVLKFPPVSMPGRLRMAAALATLKLLPSPALLEGRTAASWLRATMGAEAYQAVWEPLLKGKFGALADEIALPWFWGRVHDRTSRLGYVRGGFQRFYNRLAQRVGDRGGTLRLATQIQRIASDNAGLALTYAPINDLAQSETGRYDLIVSTLPTRLTCQLTPELSAEYRARYEWGRAYGAHCLILALDRQMTDSYWMNINDPGYPFMVFVEHTNYMSPEDYGGRHLVYLGNYRAMDDPLFTMSKDDVLREFLPHLSKINPAFDPAWVTESWMFAAPYAQPIVTTEYKRHIPPFETPIKGLFVANMFQVYPHDRGQNYSIELAERLIRHLDERFPSVLS
jgi:protoporphyrinogen oxidase